MYVFGEINNSETIVENNVVNYTQNLTTSSLGIQPIKIISGSTNKNYWNSLNVLFYTSGSTVYPNEVKFNLPSSNLSLESNLGTQFLSKYHGYLSSSLITIPSQYYGDRIKPGSFQLTESDVTDSNSNNPIIKDDGFGNLYSTNANTNFGTLAGIGLNTAISSSDNYVGNIFYDKGLVLISETGSWSGSVNYSDLGTNFDLKFKSSNVITTYEYNVNLLPEAYNLSTNYSLRAPLSNDPNPLDLSTPYLKAQFTSSDFQPYITTINLYQRGNYDTPIIQATLPKPIKKSDKINTRFKIRLDI